jgi:stage V sporulation protein G
VEITEIRIKLMDEPSERLRAFCSVTLDGQFVIRDLKIIEGTSGPFVAMPSRKLTARCPGCRTKNHLRAQFCNQCGLKLKNDRTPRDEDGRAKLYADIAHPINSRCREMMQERLVQAFHEELERSKQPGYVPSYFDYESEEYTVSAAEPIQPSAAAPMLPVAVMAPDAGPPNGATGIPAAAAPRVSDPHAHPRGPHKPPQRQSAKPRPDPSSEFGAGIFDDD